MNFWRKLLVFGGPGFMVAVGYMDPGNWATDLAAGARFNYRLLSVIMLSNFIAILLQSLAVKLGIVTGRDLAQACRDYYRRPTAIFLWVLCEIAIAACDLAEVIGSAIALNLLFGLPSSARCPWTTLASVNRISGWRGPASDGSRPWRSRRGWPSPSSTSASNWRSLVEERCASRPLDGL